MATCRPEQTRFQLWTSSALQAAFIFLRLLSLGAAENLSVGVFNAIPDLNSDRLSSYEEMIEAGFNSRSKRHAVDIVADITQYSPYGDLQQYLSADGFDLIEIDTYHLKSAVERDLVAQVPTNLPDDLLQASIDAVTLSGRVYGYPTLVCGAFLTSFAQEVEDCKLRRAQSDYASQSHLLERCGAAVLSGDDADDWERLVGGKMNYDGVVWYPELLYLDGYIDVHGRQSLSQAVNDLLLKGVVDSRLCKRLSLFISHCTDIRDENKCYHTFPGSYIDNLTEVYSDLEERKTYFFFGFFEKVTEIMRRMPVAAVPVAMGDQNTLLLYTDALVVNKARWNTASEEKQRAITDFVRYFTSRSLREKIAMGVDLNPPRPRFLLQASETFYKQSANHLYRDLYPVLKRAVAAPSFTTAQSSQIHKILTHTCFNISTPNTSSVGHNTKKKQEL